MTESFYPNVPESIVAEAALNHLREKRAATGGHRPTSDGTRGRGSISHQCARRIALDVVGAPKSMPDNDWSLIAFQVGQDWHDRTQYVLRRDFDARLEVPVSWKPRYDVSGNVDGVCDVNPLTGEHRTNLTTIEIKTMKQWSWDYHATGRKRQTYGWREAAAGPKPEHIAQAGMYALAPQLESKYLWFIYACKNDGAIAEWIIDVDEPLPHIEGNPTVRDIAMAELERQQKIFDVIDAGEIPKPVVPGHGLVADPMDDNYDTRYWGCQFCPHRLTCADMGTGRCSTETAVALATDRMQDTHTNTTQEDDLW